jgi:hypothetical protein
MSYEPPENNIHFKFTSSGYEPPSFDNVNFRFPGLAKDLGVYISPVSEDYIKECQTYVFGYGSSNIQIVNHSCVYTGFRDLGVELTYAYRFSDIPAYLKQTFPGQKDLFSILKGYASVQSDIFNIIKAVHREIPIDLYAYAKTVFPLNIDIISYVNIFQKHDISIFGILKGWVVEEQLDMLGAIKPKRKLEINLDKYLKSNERTFLDLNLEVYKIFKRSPFDIDANLHGWQTLDLLKNITPFDYSNLDVYLRCTYMDNISAYLFAITPVDLGFSLRGWQDANLYANIVNMEYPYYITSYIFGVESVNLPVFIHTRKGIAVENDLSVFLDAYYTSDLHQMINSLPALNLSAYILAKGLSSTLICKIYPKVVFSRTRLIVSYLEGRDLGATINYPCFNSGYLDMNITLNSMFSSMLTAKIFGADGSNIQDMYARVNYNTYSVENTIGSRFVKDYKDYFTSLELDFNKPGDIYGLSYLPILLKNGSISYYNVHSHRYIKDPGLLGIDSAVRFVESYRPVFEEVPEYSINREYWEFDWKNITETEITCQSNAIDGDSETFCQTGDIDHGDYFHALIEVNPAQTISRLFYKITSQDFFTDNISIYFKELIFEPWEIVDVHTCDNIKEIIRDVYVYDFYRPVGYIKIEIKSLDSGCNFHSLVGFSKNPTPEPPIREFYNFEEGDTGLNWSNSTMSLVSDSNCIGNYSLYNDGVVALYNPVSRCVIPGSGEIYYDDSGRLQGSDEYTWYSNIYSMGITYIYIYAYISDNDNYWITVKGRKILDGVWDTLYNAEGGSRTIINSTNYSLEYDQISIYQHDEEGNDTQYVDYIIKGSDLSGGSIYSNELDFLEFFINIHQCFVDISKSVVSGGDNPYNALDDSLYTGTGFNTGTYKYFYLDLYDDNLNIHSFVLYTTTYYGNVVLLISARNSESDDWVDVSDVNDVPYSRSVPTPKNYILNSVSSYKEYRFTFWKTDGSCSMYIYNISAIGNPAGFTPVVELVNSNNDSISAITYSKEFNLRHLYENEWKEIDYDYTMEESKWYRNRIYFDWENKSIDIDIEDIESSYMTSFSGIQMNNFTKDVCYGGTAFVSSKDDGYSETSLCDNDLSTSFQSNDVGPYQAFGYFFDREITLKAIKIKPNSEAYYGLAPKVFDIRAGFELPTTYEDYVTTSGVSLLLVDLSDNLDYWEEKNFSSFYLNNDTKYSVIWVVVYENMSGGNRVKIDQIEVFDKIESKDYGVNVVNFRLHNTDKIGDVWSNGFGGRNCNFYIDNVYLQKMYYKELFNKTAIDMPCSINALYIEKNLGVNIRGVINPNYKSKVLDRIITLNLKDNIEEWRRILELSFGSYMGTYTFFEGDKKVYPDEIGSNWTIVVKGYSLDNLPKGLDRVKLRRKFVFNLKKYKTIDEAIRDIIDRVSLLQSVDLGAEVVIVSS